MSQLPMVCVKALALSRKRQLSSKDIGEAQQHPH